MAESDYRIDREPDGELWLLELIEDGQVVWVFPCDSHDEAPASGTVWICEDADG